MKSIGHAYRNLEGVEVIVGDIMKSVSVYLITYDPKQDSRSGSRFASMRNS